MFDKDKVVRNNGMARPESETVGGTGKALVGRISQAVRVKHHWQALELAGATQSR